MDRRLLFMAQLIVAVCLTTMITFIAVYADEAVDAHTDQPPHPAANGKWLRVIKSPDRSYIRRGENVRFTIAVLNTSENFAMENVIIEDELTPTCNLGPIKLLAQEDRSIQCTQTNVVAPFINEVVVTGTNATNLQEDLASDTATVEILDFSAELTAAPTELVAPGGVVTFTATITNAGSTAIQTTALTSPQLGNIADEQNTLITNNECAVPVGLPEIGANGGTFQCSFNAPVTGVPGSYPIELNAAGAVPDENSIVVEASSQLSISLFELFAAALAPDREQVPAGGRVRLESSITNLGDVEAVLITKLEDTTLGDVQPYGNCQLPHRLEPRATYSCWYDTRATGSIGTNQSFVLNIGAESLDDLPIMLTGQSTTQVSIFQPTISLPFIAHIPKPDQCSTALAIETNRQYQFFHDLVQTYYRFSIDEEADLTVELTEFETDDGQVLVYRSDDGGCTDLERIGFNGTVGREMPVALGTQGAGLYYIRIYNNGTLLEDVPYSLIVRAR